MHACSHSRLPLCVLSLCLQAIDHHVFMKVRAKTLTLAFPGMALGSFIMGCFVKIFYQRWGWDLCLILGVITSATDPVAVVALLRELGAKVSLSTTIEGESLLNDGSAVVIFSVLMEIAKGVYGVNDIGIMIGTFVRMAIGGPIIGYLFGEAALIWISHVFNDALVEISISISVAYVSFYVSEFWARSSPLSLPTTHHSHHSLPFPLPPYLSRAR